jgi:hypothetical protein
LTAHEVTIQVVSQEGGGGVQISDGVGVLVKSGVDGRKTNEGGLLSLNHREPNYGADANEEGGPWGSIGGKLGVLCEHKRYDQNDGENEEDDGISVAEDSEGGELHIVGIRELFMDVNIGHFVDFLLFASDDTIYYVMISFIVVY